MFTPKRVSQTTLVTFLSAFIAGLLTMVGDWGSRAVVTAQSPSGIGALVASYFTTDSTNTGTGDITQVSGLPSAGSISGTIVTQGITTREVAVAPNGSYALAFPTGVNVDSVSVITGLGSSNPAESLVLPVGGAATAVAITSDSTTAIVVNGFSSPVTYRLITGLPSSPMVSSPFSIPNTISPVTQSGAEDVALSPSGDTALISLFRMNEAAIIDGIRSGTPRVRARVSVGADPNGVAMAPDGDTGFVANGASRSISVLSGLAPGRAPRVVATVTNGMGAGPQTIRLTPNGAVALVTNTYEGTVSIFNVSGTNLTFLRALPVGTRPAGASISADGKIGLVANADSRTLSVITGLDTPNPVVSATIGPDPRLFTASTAEQSVAFTPTGTTPPPPGSRLTVSPTSLTFNTVVGQDNPPSQTITLRNTSSNPVSFTITSSDTGLVRTTPTSGTLAGGQSATVQVSVTNPNVVGTRTAALTITSPQSNPQVVNITVNTTSSGGTELHEQEPNDSPSQANLIPTPEPGQSVSITGDALPTDMGTVVNEPTSDCDFTDVHILDWFRFIVSRQGLFQVTLSFRGPNVDYDLWLLRPANTPEGVQFVGCSAEDAGLPESIPARLAPGTYYIGVSRFGTGGFSDQQRVPYTITLKQR